MSILSIDKGHVLVFGNRILFKVNQLWLVFVKWIPKMEARRYLINDIWEDILEDIWKR